MRMYDLILKKRNGQTLSEEEIYFLINGYISGKIPDYQVSALMMAIYFKGMTNKETLALTMAMAQSGDMLDLSPIHGIKVDKHSTGGVGDKTSLALAPMVASLGVPIAKMSGRGLGHTGGTIDKLESFEGFVAEISPEQFIEQVNDIGISIMGQTSSIARADKMLYALRDVTATVDQISLVASSVMSKKLAAGADAIVLDIKTGSGAFMKKEADAFELARKMVDIGVGAGRKMVGVVTNMDEPLGFAVGNTLEVIEAIDTLKGHGPEDFTELCLTLGAYMVYQGGKANTVEEAKEKLLENIKNGKALNKLAQFIEAQGGNPEWVFDTAFFKKAAYEEEVLSPIEGYVSHIACDEIGMCSLLLGGGRETKESEIDLAVGLILHKKCKDFVKKGESLATIYGNDPQKIKAAKERFLKAYTFSDESVEKQRLILGIVGE